MEDQLEEVDKDLVMKDPVAESRTLSTQKLTLCLNIYAEAQLLTNSGIIFSLLNILITLKIETVINFQCTRKNVQQIISSDILVSKHNMICIYIYKSLHDRLIV